MIVHKQTTQKQQMQKQPAQRQSSFLVQILLCIVCAVILAGMCMMLEAGLEKITIHFKILGAVLGVILVAIADFMIFTICKSKGRNSNAIMIILSNYIALIINVVCSLMISSGNEPDKWSNIREWEEAVVLFLNIPLLSWGLVIIALWWWLWLFKGISEKFNSNR